MELSTELENMKDTKLKLAKVFNDKGKPKGNTNKQVNPKGNNKNPPKHHNENKYAWKKVPTKKVKIETKHMYGKNYNWSKWHKLWVENDPEGKLDNECQILEKFRKNRSLQARCTTRH